MCAKEVHTPTLLPVVGIQVTKELSCFVKMHTLNPGFYKA